MIYQTLNNYTLFSNSASMLLKFFMIWSSNVVRCCLLHMSIIIYRSILYLLYSYLCPCLNLNLFMSCLCDLFFIFIIINIISLNHTHLFLEHRTYSSERLLKYRTYSSECPGRSFNFGFSKEGAIRGRRSLNIKKRYQNTFILSLSSNNKSSNNNWRITTLMFIF